VYALGRFKVLPVVLAAFCTVLISFFVFSFIDSNASGGTNPVNEQENKSEENKSEENKSEGNTKGKDSTGNNDITNNVQNNVNGNKADVSNNVENNITGENADISNTIDNNLNNSNDNQIENNVTNNVEVNVNVNVSNNISNNAEASKSNSNEGNNSGDKNNGTKEENSSGNNQEEANNEEDRIIWGVDSASLTTEEMLACVTDNFGSPDIWGRYLGDKEGVSKGLTADEIELLHSNDIKILLIWNHFEDARGYENGKQQAQEAIQMAEDLGVPEGVAIFADIEPSYPVDAEFIRGWYEIMSESVYSPGVYGVFDSEQELYAALEQAGQDNGELLANTYVWTAAPNIGITTETNAPEYQPEAPNNALIGGWQYGLDAQACNIDTNLFHSNLLDVVW
jgi:hypothetical protein